MLTTTPPPSCILPNAAPIAPSVAIRMKLLLLLCAALLLLTPAASVGIGCDDEYEQMCNLRYEIVSPLGEVLRLPAYSMQAAPLTVRAS